METLHSEVESLITTLSGVIDKELLFIKTPKNSWDTIEDFKKKSSTHDLHFILTDRNLKHAKNLYDLADKNGDVDKKEVRSMLKKLTTFFDIYSKRVSDYIEVQDFTELIDKIDDKEFNFKAELAFQSELTKNVTNLREIIIRLTRRDDKSSVSVSLFNETPMPFLMKKKAEEYYPEIKEALKAKEEANSPQEN